MHLTVSHLGQKFALSSTDHPQLERNMAGRMAGRRSQEDTRMPCCHLTALAHASLLTQLYNRVDLNSVRVYSNSVRAYSNSV